MFQAEYHFNSNEARIAIQFGLDIYFFIKTDLQKYLIPLQNLGQEFYPAGLVCGAKKFYALDRGT